MSFLYRFLPGLVKVEEVDDRVKLEAPAISVPSSVGLQKDTSEEDFKMPGSFWETSKPSAAMAYPSPAITPDRRRRHLVAADVQSISMSPPVTPLKSRESSRAFQVGSTSSSSTRVSTGLETPPSERHVARRSTRLHIPEAFVKPECLEPVFLTPPSTPVRTTRQRSENKRDIKDIPKDEENIFNVRSYATRPRQPGPPASTSKTLSVINLEDLEFITPQVVYAGPSSEPPALLLQGPSGIFRNGETLKYFQALDLHTLIERERGENASSAGLSNNNVGHVLAYDMGCGKTVMSISLIIMNPAPPQFAGVKATLVIVPSRGIINHWLNELKIFAPHLTACHYSSVNESLRTNVDLVICTYAQVQRQYTAYKKDKKDKAPLYQFLWYRIIADEAHVFRNHKSETAQGVWFLQKKHGLCLTGTPAQNSLMDYYPLFKFLEVKYENIHDLKTYASKIVPKTKRSPPPPGADRLLRVLKASFFIVREKIDPKTGIKLVDLPERIDHIVDVHLTSYERDVHEHLRSLRINPLAKFTRLRQACNHPALVAECVSREQLCGDDTQRAQVFSSDGIFNYRIFSTKVRVMLEILRKRPSGEKTIIFTHFTAWFKGINQALEKEGIACAEYSGDMNAQKREESLKRIKEDSKCSVLLASIQTGGIGLNIISCNNVILMDPWWNPYVEEQAISRVHRIGQVKPVNVYHLVTVDTVEVYIMETQALKRQMIEGIGEWNYNDMFADEVIDALDEKAFNEWLKKEPCLDGKDVDSWRGMYQIKSERLD